MKNILTLLILISSISILSQPQYWNEQTSGVTVQLTSVSPNNNDVWVCGYSGTVLRTTNAGANWINVSGGGIPATVNLINIWGIDASTAVVAGYLGSDTWVWRTSNAGVNWVQVFSQPGGFINGMVFRRLLPNYGFMEGDPVGGRWSLWKTYNGGINWDSTGLYLPQAGSEAGWNNSVYISNMASYAFGNNDSLIWFGTNNTRIYYSSNTGNTWSIQSTAPEVNSYAVGFLISYPLIIDGLTGGSTLMRTTNGGNNWISQTSLGTGNFGGFVVFPAPVADASLWAGYCWYVRNDGNIYRGMNGSGWAIEYTAPAGNYRHMAVCRNNSQIWAVRSNGGITKCNCFVSGVEPVNNNIPENFSLFQNYPNPFNPVTKITFQLAETDFVNLTVYDIIGNEAEVLLNEQMQPGTFQAEWDASDYPSGVYYYRLKTNFFNDTKKMVLVK